MIQGISVTIAVSDLDTAVEDYRRAFGLPEPRRDVSQTDQVAVAMFTFGGSQLHLIAGTDAGSMIAKEVAEKGEGIHHFGFVVDSVEELLAQLAERDVRTLGDRGRPGAFGNTIGFVHPRAAHGALVELSQPGTA
jgi:methylmalonyl-CoA epimerase